MNKEYFIENFLFGSFNIIANTDPMIKSSDGCGVAFYKVREWSYIKDWRLKGIIYIIIDKHIVDE